jgi:hypothetical protein
MIMYMNLLLENFKSQERTRGNEMKRTVYYKGYNSFFKEAKKRRRKQK